MDRLIPPSNAGITRVVIVGAGFGGLKLARRLAGKKDFDIVLLDRNNYHQFQPLFYQVATSGLEPSAISFPLRKAFQNILNVHIRIAEVTGLDPNAHLIHTSKGSVDYHYLVLATGANTNFFGMSGLEGLSFPMKSITEAIQIRHQVLQNFEEGLSLSDTEAFHEATSIVIVGGGPTGVELAGAFAEMKKYVLPKDYPGVDFDRMGIFLLEASGRILGGMTEKSSAQSMEYLGKLGVDVRVNARVLDYNGRQVTMEDGTAIRSTTLIWAAGICSDPLPGIPAQSIIANNRIRVDRFCQVENLKDVYAIGDLAYMEEPAYPRGHPQVAQAAIQQADQLAQNLIQGAKNKEPKPFHYRDLGVMATVGRNLSVVDLPWFRFSGFLAWAFWMFVHLMAIVGVKNRLLIFINWSWNYLTYDQSLRLIFDTRRLRRKVS